MTPESKFYIFWTNTVWLKGVFLITNPTKPLRNCFGVLGVGKELKTQTLPIKLTLPLKALPVLQPPPRSTGPPQKAPFARGSSAGVHAKCQGKGRKEMTLGYTPVMIFTGFAASNPKMTTKEKYSRCKFHPGRC